MRVCCRDTPRGSQKQGRGRKGGDGWCRKRSSWGWLRRKLLMSRAGWCQVKVLVAQSCPILSDPAESSLCPWILQARILEWVAIPFSRGPSGPRDRTRVSCVAGGFFTIWATRGAPKTVSTCKCSGVRVKLCLLGVYMRHEMSSYFLLSWSFCRHAHILTHKHTLLGRVGMYLGIKSWIPLPVWWSLSAGSTNVSSQGSGRLARSRGDAEARGVYIWMTLTLAQCRGENTSERWRNESRSQHLQRQEKEARVLSSEAASCWEEAVSSWAHSKQAAARDCLDSQQTGRVPGTAGAKKAAGAKKRNEKKKSSGIKHNCSHISGLNPPLKRRRWSEWQAGSNSILSTRDTI